MTDAPGPVRDIDGPLLVFGGPYSNLQATLALRVEAERRGIPPDRVVCTGDVVAYGADPVETLALIRDWGIAVVAGNVEEQLAAGAGNCGCGFSPGSTCDIAAVAWYRHADTLVGAEDRAWMGSLPGRLHLRLGGRTLAVVHGAPGATNRFVFSDASDADLAAEIGVTGCDGVVAGHSGIPFARRVGDRLWLNAGVIGMPADDGTPRGWYAVLTPGPGGVAVALCPFDYDWRAARAAMHRAGLPFDYAEALGSGLWPSCDILPDSLRGARGVPLSPLAMVWP